MVINLKKAVMIDSLLTIITDTMRKFYYGIDNRETLGSDYYQTCNHSRAHLSFDKV